MESVMVMPHVSVKEFLEKIEIAKENGFVYKLSVYSTDDKFNVLREEMIALGYYPDREYKEDIRFILDQIANLKWFKERSPITKIFFTAVIDGKKFNLDIDYSNIKNVLNEFKTIKHFSGRCVKGDIEKRLRTLVKTTTNNLSEFAEKIQTIDGSFTITTVEGKYGRMLNQFNANSLSEVITYLFNFSKSWSGSDNFYLDVRYTDQGGFDHQIHSPPYKRAMSFKAWDLFLKDFEKMIKNNPQLITKAMDPRNA